MYVKLQDNIVVEVADDTYYNNLTPEEAAIYVVAPNDVRLGWLFDGTNIVAPPVYVPPPVDNTPAEPVRYALVDGNTVKEAYSSNPINFLPVEYAARFISCPAEVQAGWEYNNGIFSAPVVPVHVPQSVTMRQARLALYNAGLLTAVNNAIANAGPAAGIEWEYSSVVDRDKDLVAQLQVALNLTNQAVDDLFIAAAQIK